MRRCSESCSCRSPIIRASCSSGDMALSTESDRMVARQSPQGAAHRPRLPDGGGADRRGAAVRWSPKRTGGSSPRWHSSAASSSLMAQLAPVWLLPALLRCQAARAPTFVERLIALAAGGRRRCSACSNGALSDRTTKANAALAGIGRTRRILLSDTLLAEHSDEEIEVILAHELAHHVYRDIWSAMALEAVLITAGFYVADPVLGRRSPYGSGFWEGDVAGCRFSCWRPEPCRWRSCRWRTRSRGRTSGEPIATRSR